MTDEERLVRLEALRFEEDESEERDNLIAELIANGVYPKEPTPLMARDNWSIAFMIKFYGSRWHQWEGEQECPACKADLRDHEYGPPFGRKIGLYSQKYDRTMQWRCPDCAHVWDR